MENLLTKACAQYNDYCGTVAADYGEGVNGIDDFLSKNGFDFDMYLPYSIKLKFGETTFGPPRSTWVAILAVKKEEVGETFVALKEYIENLQGKALPAYRFYFDVGIDDFFNLFKRFEIDLGYFSKSLFDYGTTVNDDIQDEISLN